MPTTEEEWKQRLTPEQYKVLREKGTEVPFTGKYVHENKEGTYNCAACGNPLFSSDAKFDSGTGWPSFDQALPGAVKLEHDSQYGMARTEVLCAKCGSHLGHIFDDGPKETTGKRYCMNSVCLKLEERKEVRGRQKEEALTSIQEGGADIKAGRVFEGDLKKTPQVKRKESHHYFYAYD